MAWFDFSTMLTTPRRGNFNKQLFKTMAMIVDAANPSAFQFNCIPNGCFEWYDTTLSRPYCWDVSTYNGGSASMSTGADGAYSLRVTKTAATNSGAEIVTSDFLPYAGCSTSFEKSIYMHSRIKSTSTHVAVSWGLKFYDTAYNLVSSRTCASHTVTGGAATAILIGYYYSSAPATNVHWCKLKIKVGATAESLEGWAEIDRMVVVY